MVTTNKANALIYLFTLLLNRNSVKFQFLHDEAGIKLTLEGNLF